MRGPAGRRHPRRHPRPARRRSGPAAAWLPPTCWAPAGSGPWPPRPARARPSPWSVTARSACWAVLAAKAARRRADHRHEPPRTTASAWPASSAPPTSSTSAATTAIARIKDLTDGLGAHSVIEAVGTQESMLQAIGSTRPGGHVGYVGVTPTSRPPRRPAVFMSHVHLHGGPAPVRRFLPDLMDRICHRTINPGKVFDLELPLDDAADGYRSHGRTPRHQGAADRLTATTTIRKAPR